MNQKSINNYNYLIFIIFSNIFYINLIGFNFIIDTFKQNSWFIVLIITIVMVIFFLPIKSLPKSICLLKGIKNNIIIRLIIIVYLIVTSIIILVSSSLLLKIFFYPLTPIYYFMVITLLTSLFLSFFHITTIINTGSFFFSLILLFYFIPPLSSNENDLLMLLPFNISYQKLLTSVLLLLFPLDNIIFLFYSPNLKNGFSKKTFIIGNVIFMLYFFLITTNSIILLGHNYFKDLTFGGFFRWQLFKSNSFIENRDILLLYIVTVTVIYRLSVYFHLIRNILYAKRKLTFFGFMFLLIIGFSIFSYHSVKSLRNISFSLLTIMSIFIIIIYLYLIYKSRRLCFEQSIKLSEGNN